MDTNLNNTKKFNFLHFLSIFLIFILAFSIRLYWIHQKTSFFDDDIMSFSISTPNTLDEKGEKFKIAWDKINYKNFYGKTYTKGEFNKILINTDGGIKSAIKDVKDLHHNIKDVSHPNLYYILFRIWNINLKDYSFKSLCLRGCYFNLPFFTLSFILMYFFLKDIFKNKFAINIGLIFGFLNTGSISLTLLIRSYQMQETCFILLSYLFYKFLKNTYKDKNYQIPKRFIPLLVLILSITSLTGYYIFMYVILLLFVSLFVVCKSKNLKAQKQIMLTGGLLIILNYVFYNSYYYFFYSSHTTYYMNTDFDNLKLSIIYFYTSLINSLFYAPMLPFYFLLGFIKFKEHKKIDKAIIITLFVAFIWYLVVCYFSVFKNLRYVAPAFPLISIIITYLFDIRLKLSSISILSFYLFLTFNPFVNYDSYFIKNKLYFYPTLSYVYNIIDNKGHKEVEKVFVSPRCSHYCIAWKVPTTIQNFDENQKFILIEGKSLGRTKNRRNLFYKIRKGLK